MSWIGSERKPYRIDGEPQTHSMILARHCATLPDWRDMQAYEPGLSCQGQMLFHGELEATEDGTLIPHWDGDAFHHDIICEECEEIWSVATMYHDLRSKGVAGIEVEGSASAIDW